MTMVKKRKHPNSWSKEETKLLKKVYHNSKPKDLLKLFPNRTTAATTQYASTLGCYKTVQNNRKGNLEKLLNESIETYYWIGFIFADGYIHHKGHQLVVALVNDLDHLKTYAKYINCEVKSYKHPINEFTSKPCQQHRVSVRDQHIVPQLIKKFGFKPQKTYNPPSIKILKRILNTKEKFIAFISGFIDGDGCVYQSGRIKIENHSSWFDVHNFFYKMLKKYNLTPTKSSALINKRGYSQITFAGRDLINYVRNNMSFVLERKWGIRK